MSKVRQLSGKAQDEAKLRWPEPQGRADTPAVGTAYLWDGDQLASEAPLHLGGRIDWAKAVKWHYADESGYTPIAKELPDGQLLHIVSDHLGTPKEMFDAKGELVWAADHHVWGAVRTVRTHGALALKPSHDPQPAEFHCPFRFPGQYEDAETGLYYNRHRHYDPLTGQYASPDPIGLAGGDRPQGYVSNPTVWTDPLGLQARDASGRFVSPNGTNLAGPGKVFEQSVADAFRARGDQVFQNVTIRDASGKIVSYGDSIVVRNGQVRFIAEAKSSATAGASKGQIEVQRMIRDGESITFTGTNSIGIPGAGNPVVLPQGTFTIIRPGDPIP